MANVSSSSHVLSGINDATAVAGRERNEKVSLDVLASSTKSVSGDALVMHMSRCWFPGGRQKQIEPEVDAKSPRSAALMNGFAITRFVRFWSSEVKPIGHEDWTWRSGVAMTVPRAEAAPEASTEDNANAAWRARTIWRPEW